MLQESLICGWRGRFLNSLVCWDTAADQLGVGTVILTRTQTNEAKKPHNECEAVE